MCPLLCLRAYTKQAWSVYQRKRAPRLCHSRRYGNVFENMIETYISTCLLCSFAARLTFPLIRDPRTQLLWWQRGSSVQLIAKPLQCAALFGAFALRAHRIFIRKTKGGGTTTTTTAQCQPPTAPFIPHNQSYTNDTHSHNTLTLSGRVIV